mmetsp:Transcript_48485/g.109150  ORF Transcript_48485/g.109150 Transcript_48485/m.109150 type:complete len:426 (-) Transcript_48485:57-1334(-)
MGWLTDEEVEAVKTCSSKEILPNAFELVSVAQRLQDNVVRERAGDLLQAFQSVEPQECPDEWYGQLEHLLNIARILRDDGAERHIHTVNDAVREASRTSVRVVKSEDQQQSVREEMQALEAGAPKGGAEVAIPSDRVHAPACDLVEVISQGGPLVCQLVKDAGYVLQKKPVGRQGAIPSADKLASIKDRLVAELAKTAAFVPNTSVANPTGGGDICSQFGATIDQPFDSELFCLRGEDGISVSDVYSSLPMLLEKRRQECKAEPLRELQGRFLAFRVDFGTMCNPLEEYMPIFEGLFDLFRRADEKLMEEHGPEVLDMFRTMFSVVLDLLAGSVKMLGRALGAGLGVLVGAVGAGTAEAAGLATALGIGPVSAFLGGAAACALVVRGLVSLAGYWMERGSHVRVRALFRRGETGIWRVWIIELLQ